MAAANTQRPSATTTLRDNNDSTTAAAAVRPRTNHTQQQALQFMEQQLSMATTTTMAPPLPGERVNSNNSNSNNFSTADFIDRTLLNSTGSGTSKFWEEMMFQSSSASSSGGGGGGNTTTATANTATNARMAPAADPNRLSDRELLARFPSVGSLGPAFPLSRNASSSGASSDAAAAVLPSTWRSTDVPSWLLRSSESNLFHSASWAPQMMQSQLNTDDSVVYHPDLLFQTTHTSEGDPLHPPIEPSPPLPAAAAAAEPLVVVSEPLPPPAVVAIAKAAAAAAIPPPPLPRKKPIKRRRSSRGNDKAYIPDSITDNDVLMGRGGRTNHHKGNEYYLKCKTELQSRYLAAAKEDKTAISQELVDAIHARGGRFLKLDDGEDRWYVVPPHVARKKASQTLREINTPEVRAAKRAKYNRKNHNNNDNDDTGSSNHNHQQDSTQSVEV